MLNIIDFEKSDLYLGNNIDIEYKGYVEAYTLEEAKYNKELKIANMLKLRNTRVLNIKVTLESGETLDGNEKSQERMSRAINALDPEETIFWIDVNGKPQELTREQLKTALKLAGQKQTEIFIEYAQKKAELKV